MQKTDYRERIYARYGTDFQNAPDQFDRVAAERWGRARKYHLRGWLPGNKAARILDVGCGDGKLLYFLSGQGYQRIEGVDKSPDQVALARQVVSTVTQGDVIGFLEANPSSYDFIAGFDVVEHFYKDEVLGFLDAASGALRPGGRLVLQTPNGGAPWGQQLRYGDFTHELAFNAHALGHLLHLAGLTGLEARECDPPPYGSSLISSFRFGLWQLVRLQYMILNLIETGSTGDRIFTRAFVISAVKPA